MFRYHDYENYIMRFTGEGIASWGIAIGLYITLFNVIKYVEDPPNQNPAISRADSDDIVIPVEHHE